MKEQLMTTANEQLLATLENSRKYTMSVAEAMPEGSYSFKPAEGIWNFGELLNHIAYGIQWWEANYVRGGQTDWNPPAVIEDKQGTISYLLKAYDSLRETLSKGPLSAKGVNGFHATTDHITHHRGQAVIYLRCQGITPPEYTY